jgi:hypothetical protein
MTMPSEVLYLWRVEIRALGITKEQKFTFCWHIATSASIETEVVRQARSRFAGEWWNGFIITAVQEIGKLHIIDGCNLFEKD